MSVVNRARLQRTLREAEGYLELNMPRQALALLERIDQPGTFRGHLLYLKGEALRGLENFQAAVPVLVDAVDLAPSNIHAWMALGWCYKRTGRLDQAIESLKRAHEVEPSEPLIEYNLACYYSLKGAKQQALEYLSRAIAGNPSLRDLIGRESDFDPIRADPAFQALVSVVV
ncbi:MAG: tetratricopeptide repeat protein [Planctomycetia bacterium]|nr:tetratricopeptide repeat protein [Planctomycetia bacterium]